VKVRSIFVGIVAVAGVGGGLAFYVHHQLRHQADWDEVQKEAIRVDAGLRHESLLALRSRVADLDAAISGYVQVDPVRKDENRVRSLQQAIESLEWAIDHQSVSVIVDGSDDFTFYQSRPYLLAEPSCDEKTGKLLLGSLTLAKASLTYAEVAFASPAGTPVLRTTELNSLRAECSSAHDAYQKAQADAAEVHLKEQEEAAEARRRQHVREYLLQVEIENEGAENTTLYLWVDEGDEASYVLSPQQKQHLEAKENIKVKTYDTDTYSSLTFRVNGLPWIAPWIAGRNGQSPKTQWYAVTIRLGGLK
jgi:hypothetical protein